PAPAPGREERTVAVTRDRAAETRGSTSSRWPTASTSRSPAPLTNQPFIRVGSGARGARSPGQEVGPESVAYDTTVGVPLGLLDGEWIDRRADGAGDGQGGRHELELVDAVARAIRGEGIEVEDLPDQQPHARDEDLVERLVGVGDLV